jgi:hypothetical protein
VTCAAISTTACNCMPCPIEEDMLLGLDFLEANGVPLHLKEKELQIAGEVLPRSLMICGIPRTPV